MRFSLIYIEYATNQLNGTSQNIVIDIELPMMIEPRCDTINNTEK